MSDTEKVKGAKKLLETLRKIEELQKTLVLPEQNESEVPQPKTNEELRYDRQLAFAQKAVSNMIGLCEESLSLN